MPSTLSRPLDPKKDCKVVIDNIATVRCNVDVLLPCSPVIADKIDGDVGRSDDTVAVIDLHSVVNHEVLHYIISSVAERRHINDYRITTDNVYEMMVEAHHLRLFRGKLQRKCEDLLARTLGSEFNAPLDPDKKDTKIEEEKMRLIYKMWSDMSRLDRVSRDFRELLWTRTVVSFEDLTLSHPDVMLSLDIDFLCDIFQHEQLCYKSRNNLISFAIKYIANRPRPYDDETLAKFGSKILFSMPHRFTNMDYVRNELSKVMEGYQVNIVMNNFNEDGVVERRCHICQYVFPTTDENDGTGNPAGARLRLQSYSDFDVTLTPLLFQKEITYNPRSWMFTNNQSLFYINDEGTFNIQLRHHDRLDVVQRPKITSQSDHTHLRHKDCIYLINSINDRSISIKKIRSDFFFASQEVEMFWEHLDELHLPDDFDHFTSGEMDERAYFFSAIHGFSFDFDTGRFSSVRMNEHAERLLPSEECLAKGDSPRRIDFRRPHVVQIGHSFLIVIDIGPFGKAVFSYDTRSGAFNRADDIDMKCFRFIQGRIDHMWIHGDQLVILQYSKSYRRSHGFDLNGLEYGSIRIPVNRRHVRKEVSIPDTKGFVVPGQATFGFQMRLEDLMRCPYMKPYCCFTMAHFNKCKHKPFV